MKKKILMLCVLFSTSQVIGAEEFDGFFGVGEFYKDTPNNYITSTGQKIGNRGKKLLFRNFLGDNLGWGVTYTDNTYLKQTFDGKKPENGFAYIEVISKLDSTKSPEDLNFYGILGIGMNALDSNASVSIKRSKLGIGLFSSFNKDSKIGYFSELSYIDHEISDLSGIEFSVGLTF